MMLANLEAATTPTTATRSVPLFTPTITAFSGPFTPASPAVAASVNPYQPPRRGPPRKHNGAASDVQSAHAAGYQRGYQAAFQLAQSQLAQEVAARSSIERELLQCQAAKAAAAMEAEAAAESAKAERKALIKAFGVTLREAEAAPPVPRRARTPRIRRVLPARSGGSTRSARGQTIWHGSRR